MADQDIKIRIRLQNELQKGLRVAGRQITAFGRTASRIFGGILRTVTKIAAAIGVGGGLFGLGSAVRAAGQYQALQLRLEAVTGSAEKAARIFKELRDFAATTPLQLEDLIKARILLEAVGVTGQKALKGVAEVAAVFGRSVEDIALAVASLESEPLKRLGIRLQTVGDEFTFTFRDKAGREIKQVVKGVNEARRALTGIFGSRFGGGLSAASETLFGRFSTLRDVVRDALASIGNGLLGPLTTFTQRFSESVNKLIGSGTLDRFGKQLGDFANAMIGPGAMAFWGGVANLLKAAIIDGATTAAHTIGTAFVPDKTFFKIFPRRPRASRSQKETARLLGIPEHAIPLRAGGALDRTSTAFRALQGIASGTPGIGGIGAADAGIGPSAAHVANMAARQSRLQSVRAGLLGGSAGGSGLTKRFLSLADVVERGQLAKAGIPFKSGEVLGASAMNPMHVKVTNPDEVGGLG